MHPLLLLTGGLTNLLVLTLLGTDIYLFREWYQWKDSSTSHEYAQRCLILGFLLLLLLVFGKFLIRFLVGKKGQDEPNQSRSNETILVERPEGHSLFVECYGPQDAPPLIFIHGWNSNSTQWYYLKKHLSSSYRVLLLDLPGLGGSGKPRNNDYSLAKFARDLQAVIALCGEKKPVLVGHSIGGMTILTYCKLFPAELTSRIAGLVLVHTTYTNPVRTSMLSGLLTFLQKPVLTPLLHLMIILAPLVQLLNWIKYFNGSMHVSNHFMGFEGSETRGQLELATYLTTSSPVAVIARGMLAMFDYEAGDVLASISLPVLVIAANKDKMTKPEASQFIAQSIPQAQLVVLQPCGHMGPLERNAEMIEAVDRFSKAVFTLEVAAW
jgi:pimeloyl-ACP methyl ester carboxylesterase